MRLPRALRPPTIAVAGAILLGSAIGAAQGQAPALFAGGASQSEPIQVEAESLEVGEEGESRISRFEGDVVARQGDTLIKADSLTIYSPAAEGGDDANVLGQGSFTRIVADGSVSFTSPTQTATGNRGEVDMIARTVTLSGNVVFSTGGTVLTGERLTVNMDTGRARMEQPGNGRIRALINPNAVPGRR